MTLRFQADTDLHQIIVYAVIRREPTLDFQTAAAAGLMGLGDPAVLALAAHEGRVLVTHDRGIAAQCERRITIEAGRVASNEVSKPNWPETPVDGAQAAINSVAP